MNYIYDILLNFNNKIYDIYEWNKTDEITHIRKIPLFKISSTDLFNIFNNKVKLDIDFLNKIYKKTEVFTKNKINLINYSFLVTDGKEVIALKCQNSKVIEYSKLLYEEELEVLEYSESIRISEFKYEVLGKINNTFETRNENSIKKYIYKQLSEIIKEQDEDKLNYIYLECFDKITNKDIKKQIYLDLQNNWDDVYLKLYDFLKKILLRH